MFQHKHYPKWAAEAGLPVPCTDCGFVPFDHYMVWDELWAKAGLDPREICCLECLERRLGRPLGVDDFPPLPVNRLAYAAARHWRKWRSRMFVIHLSVAVRIGDTVPVPTGVKAPIDQWLAAAVITRGYVLRSVDRDGRVGESLSGQAILDLVAEYAAIKPHDLRRTCAKLCRRAGGELEQIQLLLGHASIATTERYLGTQQNLVHTPNDRRPLTFL